MLCALVCVEVWVKVVRDSQLELEARWNSGKDGRHSGEFQVFG